MSIARLRVGDGGGGWEEVWQVVGQALDGRVPRARRCGQRRGDVLTAPASSAHVHAHGVRRRQRLSRVFRGGGRGGRGDGRDGHGACGVIPHGRRTTHHVRVAVPVGEVGRLEVAGRCRGGVHGRGGSGRCGGHCALLMVVVMVVVVLQKVVMRGVVRLGCGRGGRGGGGNLVRRGRVAVRCRRRRSREVGRMRRRRGREHCRGGVSCGGGGTAALLRHPATERRHGGNRIVACARVGNRLVVAVVIEDGVFSVNLGKTKLSVAVLQNRFMYLASHVFLAKFDGDGDIFFNFRQHASHFIFYLHMLPKARRMSV